MSSFIFASTHCLSSWFLSLFNSSQTSEKVASILLGLSITISNISFRNLIFQLLWILFFVKKKIPRSPKRINFSFSWWVAVNHGSFFFILWRIFDSNYLLIEASLLYAISYGQIFHRQIICSCLYLRYDIF